MITIDDLLLNFTLFVKMILKKTFSNPCFSLYFKLFQMYKIIFGLLKG